MIDARKHIDGPSIVILISYRLCKTLNHIPVGGSQFVRNIAFEQLAQAMKFCSFSYKHGMLTADRIRLSLQIDLIVCALNQA